MGARYLTDLADVCRGAGLSVVEVEDWETRARGSGGYDSGRPNHVMVHHTASPASADGWGDVNYICFGDEDAPLSNLYLGRSGQVWICAAGATNTNGSGSDPCGVTADDSMNSSAIGIEAGNNGTGERWPDAQLDAYARLVSALCLAYGIPNERIHAHQEWAPDRKVDPAGPDRYAPGAQTWDMNEFRADCAGGPVPPPPGDDDDMDFDGFWRRDNSDAVYAIFKHGGKQWMTDPGYQQAMHDLWAVRGAPASLLGVKVQKDPAMFAAFGLVEGPREPGTDEWGNKT